MALMINKEMGTLMYLVLRNDEKKIAYPGLKKQILDLNLR